MVDRNCFLYIVREIDCLFDLRYCSNISFDIGVSRRELYIAIRSAFEDHRKERIVYNIDNTCHLDDHNDVE